MRIWLGDFQIGAAFIVAGLAAAWQCPIYLKQAFPNVYDKYPGVRFDIESPGYKNKVTTTLQKEIWGYPKVVREELLREPFGCLLSSEEKHITVLHARSLLKREEQWEPLYKTLMTGYLERMVRVHSNDFKKDLVLHFFNNHPDSQKNRWNTERQYVNSILSYGDRLNCRIEEEQGACIIHIVFGDEIKEFSVRFSETE